MRGSDTNLKLTRRPTQTQAKPKLARPLPHPVYDRAMQRAWTARALACASVLAASCLSACPGPSPLTGGPLAGECGGAIQLRTSYAYPSYPLRLRADILFVIDNGPTMAEQQARLAAAGQTLIDALDEAGIDYHLGFTTTDNGNPWCPDTTPEHGQLVLESCRERLPSFAIDDGMGGLDQSALACTDQCSLGADALEVTPTPLSVGWGEEAGELAPRPWLEGYRGGSNLPEGTELAEAFRCFAPQGIDGCDFASPLESLYLALSQTQASSDPHWGFARPGAIQALVVLTDSLDCSYAEQWAEIFDAAGSKVFWSDPSAAAPTQAVCWNAGVGCSGEPSAYDSCEPTSHNYAGAPSDTEGLTVLHPVRRYTTLLEGLEQEQQQIFGEQELLTTIIAGVEGGGAEWSLSYAEAQDPALQTEYGIGPGCVGSDGPAPPPVRLRALGEAFGPESLWSVCAEDYGPALADLAQRIHAQLPATCYRGCVGDGDRSTPKLDPVCTFDRWGPGDARPVRECLRDAAGHYRIDETGDYLVPEGEDDCVALLVDPDGSVTSDPNDDLSSACAEGTNLEFAFVHRPGLPADTLPIVTVDCESSDCADQDCPQLADSW